MSKRTTFQKIKDFITFPLRIFILSGKNWLGLSSRQSERFDYVSREVIGYCLDIGCGRYNRFISEYQNSNGRGIDIWPYEGFWKKTS